MMLKDVLDLQNTKKQLVDPWHLMRPTSVTKPTTKSTSAIERVIPMIHENNHQIKEGKEEKTSM